MFSKGPLFSKTGAFTETNVLILFTNQITYKGNSLPEL